MKYVVTNFFEWVFFLCASSIIALINVTSPLIYRAAILICIVLGIIMLTLQILFIRREKPFNFRRMITAFLPIAVGVFSVFWYDLTYEFCHAKGMLGYYMQRGLPDICGISAKTMLWGMVISYIALCGMMILGFYLALKPYKKVCIAVTITSIVITAASVITEIVFGTVHSQTNGIAHITAAVFIIVYFITALLCKKSRLPHEAR